MTNIDNDNNDEDDDHHHHGEEEEEEIVLPGYDAGVNESGVEHSQLKLKESAKRLSLKLLEIIDQNRCQNNQNNDHEEEKGIDDDENENSSRKTTTQTIDIQTFSCLNEEETLTYRCRCNFQIVQIPETKASLSSSSSFRYAMRSKGQPVLLGTKNSFPIATRRIQSAMKEFMDYTNNNNYNENNNENNSNNTIITTSTIANKYLTSCTFSSAWNDVPDADCVLTLNYDQQYLDLDDDDDDDDNNGNGSNKNKIAWKWKQEAQLLCQKLRLRQINGRSKGTLLSVREGGGEEKEGDNNNNNNNSNHGCNDDDNANENDKKEATIRDTVYLLRSDNRNNDNDKTVTMKVKWNVSLEGQQKQQQRPTGGSVITEIDCNNDDNHNNNDGNDDGNNKSTIVTTTIFPVHYEKPETAFYHPNPNAMTKALAWMLDRLTCISISKQDANNDSKLKLLEMYCGCGAHTVALGRSGLISQILAIELDPRLVRSCEKNISLNGLQNLIKVYRGDAGRWSKEESRRRRRNRQRSRALVKTTNIDLMMRNSNNDDDNGSCNYDVLLVDPPRQGLDEEVCRMAMMTMSDDDDNNDDDNKVHRISSGDNNNNSHGGGGCFQNILYVSCGHQALLRDLERLSPVYEVVNCAQMDLFPRTDSIETLVHLRKRTATFT
jgi:tRNA/tmRNA/rRNA uracil-C5-methylase (TrmA/RlmC/RlmD family)